VDKGDGPIRVCNFLFSRARLVLRVVHAAFMLLLGADRNKDRVRKRMVGRREVPYLSLGGFESFGCGE
jgi:hypothetical protein